MTPRICLLALIGLPAAGKTHLSRRLLNETSCDFNVIHMCYDQFMEMPTPSVDTPHKNTYKKQREQILDILGDIIGFIQNNAIFPTKLEDIVAHRISDNCRDYVIICDDNNYYASMRYKLYQLCRQHGLSYAQLHLACPLPVSWQRNEQRLGGERVPQHILLQMSERLELPTCTWEANTMHLVVDEGPIELEPVVRFLQESFSIVPPKLDTNVENSVDTTQSMVHQLDLLLRQRIREILNALDKTQDKATKAQHLNAKRKEILIELREQLSLSKSSGWTSEELGVYVRLLN